MPYCAAFNCTNRLKRGSGITFHRFPKPGSALLKEWLVKMRRDKWIPNKYSTMCSIHFEEVCFDRTGQTTRLREGSIPTSFNFPAHLKKTLKPRKPPPNRSSQDIPVELPSTSTTSPILMAGTLNKPSRPTTPVKQHDHTYSITESPRSMKRKLEKIQDTASSLQKRLKNTQKKTRRLRKKVDTLETVVKALKEKNLLSENGLEVLQAACNNVPAELLKRLVKAKDKDGPSKEKYPAALRAFALTLNFYSAKAYRFVRKTFNLQLPHPSVIRKWYSTIDGQPGFTSEAFNSLEAQAKEAKEKGNELVCALMIDEMAIKKYVQWDGKKFHGYVDMGTGCSDDSNPVATEALVFMVVPLNASWKIPVGYFLIKSLTGKERANLVKQCLSKLSDVGIWIQSITCDGPSCHFSMLEALGAKMTVPNLTPSFSHPQNPEHQVHAFLDICHMLKLMRNTLASYGIIKDGAGNPIKWQYVKELHKVQEDEGLRLGNKLKNAHMEWTKQKMKVNLAAQTLSTSVADAIEFLQEQGLPQFQGSAATVRFIRTIDRLFDVLNSRNPKARGYKAPLRQSNYDVWHPFLSDAYEYIATLTDAGGRKMFTTPRKTAFIGFLAGIKSAQSMYETLVGGDAPKLKYVLTYKMSQDHLELFFCAMRSSLGSNNNPTAREFSTSYRKMLVRHEIQGIGGNCVAQDRTSILHVSSCTSSVAVAPQEDDILLVRKYDLSTRSPAKIDHDYSDMPNITTLSSYKSSAISYISGYVVKMTRRYVSCEECLTALTTGEAIEGSFLEKKNRGGLVRPTPDVVKVCEMTEKCFQRMLIITGGDLPQGTGLTHAISSAVLGEIGNKDIFNSLYNHMFDCEPHNNHLFILIKRIAFSYVTIRMHHLARRMNEKLSGPLVRKKLSKLILFKHQ